MKCYIYRSNLKSDAYLYLQDQAQVEELPEGLVKLFGKPEFAFEFELTPERRLASADTGEVLRQLEVQGFYLQLPPEPDLLQQ